MLTEAYSSAANRRRGSNKRGCSCRPLLNRIGVPIEGRVFKSVKSQQKEGANRRGYACWELFNRKGVREGGLCW